MGSLNTSLFFGFNQFADQSAFCDWLIVFFASYLAYILIAVFILGLVFWKISQIDKIKIGFAAIISLVVGRGIAVETIRFFYHHPRPNMALSGVHQLLSETSYSFPSGHATLFFALSAVVYHYNKKAGVIFFVLSLLMGFARIAAGVHYPLDILGGAIIGTFVGALACSITENFIFKKEKPLV